MIIIALKITKHGSFSVFQACLRYNCNQTESKIMSEKVLILGLSKSGIAAAKFAASKGYDVYITESKGVNEAGRLDNPATPQGIKGVNEGVNPQIEELKSLGIKIECGLHSEKFISGSSFAVTSPGIPPKSEIFRRLNEKI